MGEDLDLVQERSVILRVALVYRPYLLRHLIDLDLSDSRHERAPGYMNECIVTRWKILIYIMVQVA